MKILIIEDKPADALLAKRTLISQRNNEMPLEIEVAGTLKEARAHLAKGGIEAVLTDLNLPDAKDLEAVQYIRKAFPDVACVVLTGTCREESIAQKAVKMGAQDYLLKEDLTQNHKIVVRSLRYAVERHQLLRELEQKNKELESLNKVMMGREERILELKQRVEHLERELKQRKT